MASPAVHRAGEWTDRKELDDDTIMMGREGNVVLVNGEVMPALDVQPGGLTRLRIVNVANGRFFNLALPGHTFRVIGADGGLIPKPYDTERLLVSPGERYDVLTPTQREVFWRTSLLDKNLSSVSHAGRRGHGDGVPDGGERAPRLPRAERGGCK